MEKKDLNSALNLEYKYLFKKLIWPLIYGKMGGKIGLFITTIYKSPKYSSKEPQKPHKLYPYPEK